MSDTARSRQVRRVGRLRRELVRLADELGEGIVRGFGFLWQSFSRFVRGEMDEFDDFTRRCDAEADELHNAGRQGELQTIDAMRARCADATTSSSNSSLRCQRILAPEEPATTSASDYWFRSDGSRDALLSHLPISPRRSAPLGFATALCSVVFKRSRCSRGQHVQNTGDLRRLCRRWLWVQSTQRVMDDGNTTAAQ